MTRQKNEKDRHEHIPFPQTIDEKENEAVMRGDVLRNRIKIGIGPKELIPPSSGMPQCDKIT